MSSRKKPITRQILEQRQREAAVRQEEYDALTLEQKLERLPPEPHAARQRARLLGQPTPRPVNSEGQFVKFGDKEKEVSDKPKMKAKDRRAQEKNQ